MKRVKLKVLHDKRGSSSISIMLCLLISFIVLVTPLILFVYEKNRFYSEKDRITSIIDAAIYNTYCSFETQEVSEGNFIIAKESLNIYFEDNLRKSIELSSPLSTYKDYQVKSLSYDSIKRVFYLDIDVNYNPIFLKALDNQVIDLNIEYVIPVNN